MNFKDLPKLIKFTGDLAKLDTKANETYIVYKTSQGPVVKEYSDGNIFPISQSDGSYASYNVNSVLSSRETKSIGWVRGHKIGQRLHSKQL